MNNRKVSGFTLVELLVVIAIIGILIGMLLPAVQQVREAARRIDCSNKSRQIGLAVINYESSHGEFPPGWIVDPSLDSNSSQLTGWGWTSIILPFLEANNLAELIDFNGPVDADLDIIAEVLPVLLCTSDPDPDVLTLDSDVAVVGTSGGSGSRVAFFQNTDSNSLRVARSNYSGVFGTLEFLEDPNGGDGDVRRSNGVFFADSEVGFRTIRDGSSNTMMIGERRNDVGTVTWSGVIEGVNEPFARIVGAADLPPNAGPQGSDDTLNFETFRSYHPGGINVTLADGSTQFINDNIDEITFRALSSVAGGEVVSLN